MKLAEALDLISVSAEDSGPARPMRLVCGFTPLHLSTFLKAHSRLRLGREPVEVIVGSFGDLTGNVETAIQHPQGETALIIEWPDLDPRLGLRSTGDWTSQAIPDIQLEVNKKLSHLRNALGRLAEKSIVALSGPTLPLPPIAHTHATQETAFELRLRAMTESFLADVAQDPRIRVLSESELAAKSPYPQRFDAGSELVVGFPYTLGHADSLASLLIQLLFPSQSKKGLITDLDDTLWQGLVGENGPESVAWDLQRHAQHHGVYQKFLAALGERGILIGIASKNDPTPAMQALERPDILIPVPTLFPIELHWEPKSASVERILRAWNLSPADVVLVDDSPMERAEVQAAFPEITCLAFPRASHIGALLSQLRCLFGRPEIVEEDRLRSPSIRVAGMFRENDSHAQFLDNVGGMIRVNFSKDTKDRRALELINKTNQFNLNGRRYTDGEWQAHLDSKKSFLATFSYEDKFGSLGRVLAATGFWNGDLLRVLSWVMSCRAFSRRIEYHALESLFTRFATAQIEFDYEATKRNGLLGEFFRNFLDSVPASGKLCLTKMNFNAKRPSLPHAIEEVISGSGCNPPAEMLPQGLS